MNNKRARRFAEDRAAIKRRKELERERREQAQPIEQPARPTPARREEKRYCPSCNTEKPSFEFIEGSLTCRGCNKRQPDGQPRMVLGGTVLE